MRISVRSSDARRARALQDMLLASGVEATAQVGPLAKRGRLEDDIVILDARADTRAWAIEEARRLAQASTAPSVVVAVSAPGDPPTALCENFDGWVQLGAPAGIVARELAAIRREGEARLELRLRLETARDFEVSSDPGPRRSVWRSLYIGEPSPFYLAQERALSSAGGRLEAAFSSFMGFDYLHEDRFDSVTLNAANDSATALALCGALRRNARLHNLPTAVIVRRFDEATISGAVDRGATQIVYADEAPQTPIAWLFERIDRGRRQRQTEESLEALQKVGDGPRLTSPAFLEAHLSRLVEVAHTSARPLTLVALKVALAPGARMPSAVSWARGIGEISGFMTRLSRITDTAALLHNDLIVTAMPNTHAGEARRMAERVTGVVECTSFAMGGTERGPIVLERCIAELAPGESSAGLLSRALGHLTPEGACA